MKTKRKSYEGSKNCRTSKEWEARMRKNVCIPHRITLPKATHYALKCSSFDKLEKEIALMIQKNRRKKKQ